MKKIITLSIVCLVSGQLFAQSDAKAQPAAAQTKSQIDVQKQKEVSAMSLPQVQNATAATVTAEARTTTAQKAAVNPAKAAVNPAVKPVQETKQVQEVKQVQELKATEPLKAEPAKSE